jgi:beta-lactam-binding protein with PASTA domain/serine/threonine protein kinase
VTTATSDPLVGRALEGRYRIRHRIARGGMSTVYSAVDERLDRLVAVKVMSTDLSADPAFNDRVAREARAAARLAHINAVAVYDQGEDAGHVFLVMELVTGRTLRDLLRERGRLPPAEAVSIMEPVLAALALAHDAGLVHRDIKPENILLSDEGVVKVADFGLARAVEAGDVSSRSGLMMGTVAYCSPEQITRQRTDQRSDVYSAGIVLYELLTGAPPFTGDSPMTVAYQHVHGQVPAPSARVKGIAPQLDDLVLRATANHAGGRPLDAGAFLAELGDVRTDLGLPVVAVPPRPRSNGPARTGSPVRRRGDEQTTDRIELTRSRHDTLVDGPKASALRPSGGAGAAPPPIVIPPALQPGHRRRRTVIGLVAVLLIGLGAGFGGWWLVAGRYARVPDVAGFANADATKRLDQAGFKVATTRQTQFSETIAKGSVIRTSPGSGARARRGATVTVILSAGQERYVVPRVRGQAESAARAALSTIPVTVVSRQTADDQIPKGQVIGTQPAIGQQVRRGQVITIIVSTGPPFVTVPDVTNQSQDSATAALQGAKFTVTVQQQFSDTAPEGTVISEQPAANQQAVKGSTVTIAVSKGPEYVELPNVSGKTGEQATALLSDAGLNVVVQHVFGGRLNITVGLDVAPQDRNAAGQVRKGATVTISVA